MNVEFKKAFELFVAGVLFVGLITGCAYRFSNQDRRLPGGYDRIAVPVFGNLTQETGVEAFFTSAMLEEIQRDMYSKVVPKHEAQVILEAEITDVLYAQATLTEREVGHLIKRPIRLVREYRIFVNVAMRLKRISDLKLLWSGSFQGEKQFPAPQVIEPKLDISNANYTHSAKMQNMKILAKDVMNQAYTNLTENF